MLKGLADKAECGIQRGDHLLIERPHRPISHREPQRRQQVRAQEGERVLVAGAVQHNVDRGIGERSVRKLDLRKTTRPKLEA